MKNLLKMLLAVVMLAAYSCTTDTTEDVAVNLGNGVGDTSVVLSLEESRTQLGEEVNGLYPLTWSAGDKISVNGVESGEAVIDSSNPANATFTIGGTPVKPYCIAYPAAAEGQVLFAAEQVHTSNTSFGNGVATMYGYGENGLGLQLHHLTGVLKIGVTGNAVLTYAQISTVDRAPIAGAFNLDFATGELTATKDSKEVINYTIPAGDAGGDNGLVLSETPQYIHVAVPAGVYDELYVTLYDENGGVMYATVKADDKKPLTAGKVRTFSNAIVYAPNANVHVIKDVETLKAFAAAAPTSSKDALFVADVDMTGEAWTPIEGYSKTIHGNGYSIKGLTAPLFGTTNASIKGLHLRDVVINTNEAPIMGALACTVTATDDVAPVIEHCSASGTLTVNNKTLAPQGGNSANELVYAGLVARAIGTSLDNCENKVAVTVDHLTVAGDTKDVYPFIAGVLGYAAEFSKTSGEMVFANVTNCTNSAAVTYQDQSFTELPTARAVYIAGILSRCGAANDAIISNNTNDAPITIQNTYVEHSNRSMVGGVVARTGHITEFTNNKNTANGTITITGNILDVYAGGIGGYLADAVATFNEAPCTMLDCANYADVYMEVPNAVTVDLGGFGGCISYFNMDNCHNYGKVVSLKGTAKNTTNATLYVAGFIARTTGDDAEKRAKYYNGSNSAAVTAEFADQSVKELRVAGITAYSHSSWNSFTNEKSGKVLVKGNITSVAAHSYYADKNSDTQIVIGGIGGYLASTASYDCFNYGDVEVDATWVTTKASFIQIGGLTGRTHNKIYRGVNYGNVYLKGDTTGVLSSAKADIKDVGEVTCYGMTFVGGCAGITYWDCTNMTNEGNIYVTGNHNHLEVGGCAGGANHAADNFINKGNISVDATYNLTTNIGGCVGYGVYNGQGDVLNCENYGSITVKGTQGASGEVHIGGVAGDIDGSHNKNLYNHKGGDIYVNMTSSSAKIHIGGVMYKSKDALTGGVNEGNITVEGKIGSTLYIGGGVCVQNGYARTDLTNKGNITVGANIKSSCFVGGICYDGQYDKTWKNCHNEGDIEFTKSFTSTGNVRCGGIIAKLETANHYGIFDGCSNSGDIAFNGHTDSYLRLGGMIGCLKSGAIAVVHNGFTNSGNISFNGTVAGADNVHLGGIIGCPSGTETKFSRSVSSTTTDENGAETTVTSEDVWTGNIVNTGTITITGSTENGKLRAGGIFGLIEPAVTTPFTDAAKFYALGDVVNTGNPGENGFIEAAGVVPFTNIPISGVECHCYVNAPNGDSVGMVIGSERSEKVYVKDCKVGGKITYATMMEDANEGVEVKTTVTEVLNGENFYKFIYSAEIDEATATADGLSFLSVAPTPPITPPATEETPAE